MEYPESCSSHPSPPSTHLDHAGCPDNLGCLPDSDSKPRDTFATIIRCAILGTPGRRMTLNAIYTAIEAKYPYYRDAGPGWKNTVRHVLSTSQQFEKSRRPITEPGKGGYWSVNLNITPKGEGMRQRRSNVSKATTRKDPPIQNAVWPAMAPVELGYLRDAHQAGHSESDDEGYPSQEHLGLPTQISHIPQMSQYHYPTHLGPLPQASQIAQLTPALYPYNNSSDRPGWLTEVSWSNVGNLATGGHA